MAENRSLGHNLGIGDETIRKACHMAVRAHMSPEKPYLLEKTQSEGAVFAFPGSWSANDWFADGPPPQHPANPRAFGETKVDLGMFRCLRSISIDEVATVNDAFLQRFLNIKNNSDLFNEVDKALKDNKQIIFTGHSSGGPIAVFATIWFFEQLRLSGTQTHRRTFCLTFGSPLTADRIFCHAVRRENWANSFVHFVSRYDIIPRVPLSPPSSTKRLLHEVLSRLNPNGPVGPVTVQSGMELQLASDFFITVLRNVSCVARHAASALMRSTSLLMDTVSGFVELSPYRPFGTFVFSSGSRKLFIVKNPDAVLQIMFYSLQLGSDGEGPDTAAASLASHLTYETELGSSLETSDIVCFDECTEIPLNSRDDADHEAKMIDAALTDFGLSATARLCLRAAIGLEKQKTSNQMKIEQNRVRIERAMVEVESYRAASSARGVGYFDSFKLMKSEEDFKANIKRLELVGLVDEIVEMLKRYELPEAFEGDRSWVRLGTQFRHLLEPLDIANYYRLGLNEDTGPYMARGRPRRYKYIQRWLEHLERMPGGSCCESTVWAEVEELIRDESVISASPEILRLERNLKEWYDKGVVEKGAFAGESSLVWWWKALPEQHKAQSCIREIIQSSSST